MANPWDNLPLAPNSPKPWANLPLAKNQNAAHPSILSELGTGLEKTGQSVLAGSHAGLNKMLNLGGTEFDRNILSLLPQEASLRQQGQLPTDLQTDQSSKAPYPMLADISEAIPTIAMAGAAGAAAPEVLGGLIPQSALSGSLYSAADTASKPGQTQSDIGKSAVEGALTGAAFGGAGKALGAAMKIPKAALKRVSDEIISKVVTPMQEKISQQVGARLSKISSKPLKDAYEAAKKKASDWKGMAQSAPEEKFDNSEYLTEANKVLEDAQNEESQRPALKGLSSSVQELIDRAPKSFKNAIKHKQAINDLPDSYEQPISNSNSALRRQYAGRLGQALDNQVQNNATTYESQTFVKNWLQKRKDWGNLQKFYQAPGSATGRADFDPTLKKALENGDFDKYTSSFIPKSGEGMAKVQALGRLVGDHEKAGGMINKQALKGMLSEDSNGNLQVDPHKLANYMAQSKNSDSVKLLFPHSEKEAIGNLHFAKNISSQLNKSKGKIGHLATDAILRYGLPSGIGYEEGKKYGSPKMGALAGLAVGKIAPEYISKVFQNIANKAIESGRIKDLHNIGSLFDDINPRNLLEKRLGNKARYVPKAGTVAKYPALGTAYDATLRTKSN